MSLRQIENCPATLMLEGTAYRTQDLVFCSTARSFTSVKKFMFLEQNKKKKKLGKINLIVYGEGLGETVSLELINPDYSVC